MTRRTCLSSRKLGQKKDWRAQLIAPFQLEMTNQIEPGPVREDPVTPRNDDILIEKHTII